MVQRIVELYRNGWLRRLPCDFLDVYLISPHVFCTREEVSTYNSSEHLDSINNQPAVIWSNGKAEWWNANRGLYHSCIGYLDSY